MEEAAPLKGSPVSVRIRPGVRLSGQEAAPAPFRVADCSVSRTATGHDRQSQPVWFLVNRTFKDISHVPGPKLTTAELITAK